MINFGKGFFRIVLVISVFTLLLAPIAELEKPLATEMGKYQDGIYENLQEKWKSEQIVKNQDGRRKRYVYPP